MHRPYVFLGLILSLKVRSQEAQQVAIRTMLHHNHRALEGQIADEVHYVRVSTDLLHEFNFLEHVLPKYL